VAAGDPQTDKIVVTPQSLLCGAVALCVPAVLVGVGALSFLTLFRICFWSAVVIGIIFFVARQAKKRQELVDAGAIAFGPAGHSLVLFADRIRTPDGDFPLDPSVSASVETSGTLLQRQQLTATRMVALGVFALAAPKVKTTDNRKLYILVEGTSFQSVTPVNPNKETEARKFAALVTTKARQSAAQSPALEPVGS
jgi:hypothetical protein